MQNSVELVRTGRKMVLWSGSGEENGRKSQADSKEFKSSSVSTDELC
jgi:hypothetical protein